jgi:GEVED domain/Fibronectin type III domain/Secretion system C-terminal sorting domain
MKTSITLLLLLCLLRFNVSSQAQCVSTTTHSVTFGNNVSTFDWDSVSGALSYSLQLKFSYSNNWLTLQRNLTTSTFSYTGLMQSATFNWRVMTKCSPTDSIYGASQTYTVPCEKPNTLTVTNITGTTATLNWVPAPVIPGITPTFAVAYRKVGSTGAWTSVTSNTSATSVNVTGLSSNTAYDFCVNKNCSYFMSDPAFGQFTTQYVPCDIPTNLSQSLVTNNSAYLSWTHVNGYVNYYVQYKKSSQSNWTTVYAVNNHVSIANLSQETLYDWRVMANCSNAFQSVYSATKQFTTYSNTCMSYGSNNNSEWIDLFSVGAINRTSGREIGGYFRSSASTNLGKGFTYTATISCGYVPGIAVGDYYAIYIDFNKNGTFTEANELVVAPGTLITGTANYTSTFTIPTNVSLGTTKMRVILRRSTSTITPCAVGFQGETEDYTVNITNTQNMPFYANEETYELNNIEANARQASELFAIAPNPSNGIFEISLAEDFAAVAYEITSISGQIIERNTINANRFQSDLSTQAKGMYLLKLKDLEGNIYIQKMMVH